MATACQRLYADADRRRRRQEEDARLAAERQAAEEAMDAEPRSPRLCDASVSLAATARSARSRDDHYPAALKFSSSYDCRDRFHGFTSSAAHR